MANDALLQAAKTAARAGDLETAAALFARLVKEEPNSEPGWLGLGFCFSDKAKREFCFRRVLAINPNNMQAKQSLELMVEDPLASALRSAGLQATSLPPASMPPVKAAEPPKKPARMISPFMTGDEMADENAEPAFLQTMRQKSATPDTLAQDRQADRPPVSMESISTRNTPVPVAPSPPKAIPIPIQPAPTDGAPAGPDLKKKKIKPLTVVLWITILPLLACLAGFSFLLFSGKGAELLQTYLHPISTPTQFPTQTAVPTLPPTPTPSTTPSPLPSATPTLGPKPTLPYVPSFAKAACRFASIKDVEVTCGYVSLPEDRTNPKSRTIQLAVAIFHSINPNPAPDPVVFLQGGPGGEAVRLSGDNFELLVKPFLSQRDYIAFDQRGTGISIPALSCDELEKVYRQDIAGQIPATSRDYIYTNAYRSCHGAMTLSGIELNSYTTLASSDDLKDIVSVLGYKQVNLYAASYGTRLALVTMRDHPDLIRSAVLDSVVPVEAKLFNEDPVRYGASLQALFDGCAADLKCNTAFPNLKTVFWDLVEQLDAKPVTINAPLPVGPENIDGSYLIGVVVSLLKSTRNIAYAPQIIYQIKSGNYSTFVAMQSSLPYEFQGINIGLYISVMCHEHILATTPTDLQAAMDSQHNVGRYFRLPFFGNAETLFNTCKIWGAVPPVLGENDTVVSDIPALIIEGKYDPATPPAFGKQVAANLGHSYYMEFPNQGHTPSATDISGCAFKTMLAFFANPALKPDMTCLSTLKGVNFIVP